MRKISMLICLGVLLLALAGCGSNRRAEQNGETTWPGTSGNPIITSIFTADPSAHVWPSDPYRLFLYPSQDMFPPQGCDLMDRYHVFSTSNMVDWVNHGEIMRRADIAGGEGSVASWAPMTPGDNGTFMWAPDAFYNSAHPYGWGPYFFIFPVALGPTGSEPGTWNDTWKLGIAHSSRPEGSFLDNPVVYLTDHLGNPVHGGGHYIDPSVFYNASTGYHYLVVGGSAAMRVARLAPNMVSLAEPWTIFEGGSARITNGLNYFHEGPWMFSRVNDHGTKLYYVMYAADRHVDVGGGRLAYATSTAGPHGPWTFGGIILGPVTGDTNHGSIVEFPLGSGEWYLFYHTNVLSMGQDTLRSSSVERIFFNPDGSIIPVTPTEIGVNAIGPPECPEYLDRRFGVGNWTIEMRSYEFFGGLATAFDGFGLRNAHYATGDYVNVYLAEILEHTGAVHNLHIAGSYVAFTNVYGGAGGTALLEVNYSTPNGGLAEVIVNGTTQYVLRSPATGGWEDFTGAAVVPVYLLAGINNTVRIGGLAMNIRSIAIYLPDAHQVDRPVGSAGITPPNPADIAMASLTWEDIKGTNTSARHVTTNLSLFTNIESAPDAEIIWHTSNPDIIGLDGRVTRPRYEDTNVTVTSTVTVDGYQASRSLILTVAYLNFEVGEIGRAIPTVFPTKDFVISDFIVTDFGARAEPGFDNRAAFQAAIDAAHEAGGGVVFIPAGNYEFHSTQVGTMGNVRYRAGPQAADEERRSFQYEFVLTLPQGVQLRGDWANPDEHDGLVLGTILEVHVGHNAPNASNVVPTWWNDPQAGYALFSTYTDISDRFIEMNESTGVTNLSIWHPNQDIDNVVPYPWALFQTRGNSATIENVTLVNAYNGFMSAPSELHYVLNSYMTALNTAIQVHVCTDIGRIENVKISPAVWANSGLPNAPSFEAVRAHTRIYGTGFRMHRSDWEYVAHLYITGYNIGMWIGREPGFVHSPNAQFFDIRLTDNATSLFVQDVNPYGLLISNSVIGGDTAVYFYEYFETSVQFNGVQFLGPVVSDGRAGVISFESCTFGDTAGYALQINSGNIILTQSRFLRNTRHMYLGEYVNTVMALNSGYGEIPYERQMAYSDSELVRSSAPTTRTQAYSYINPDAVVDIVNNAAFIIEEIPPNIRTDIAVHPRPPLDFVLRADLPRATELDDIRPTIDVSNELQASLDAVAALGGGTVFLPAGRYLVNNPIVIPSNVELRGSWDVQHHTQGGGTAIFTNYTGGHLGENGASLIQLQANSGIRGLKIAQLNLTEDGYTATNPRRTPFLIQGQGHNVHIINITVSLGDKGIDLFTYDTSGHYVDYFAGAITRAGIWVGGGADGGFIRNMQLNPHYALRFPRGRQGFPYPRNENNGFYLFIQGNSSALRFGDVTNQTIFNNFVFGSVYGIHFVKDEITGRYPGEIIVVGHGSDGCTFALNVESAGPDTRIIAINSQLVNTLIEDQPVRAYVLMGDMNEANSPRVHPDAQLILYNTSFWGSPTAGAIISNGVVRFHQANFSQVGMPGIDILGGSAHVYTSFFANARPGSGENAHVRLHESGNMVELSNNFFAGGVGLSTARPMYSFGSDIARYFDPSVLTLSGMGSARFNPLFDEVDDDIHLAGWDNAPAWIRFNHQSLANGIARVAFHYAHGADPIPLVLELRVAEPGTIVTGTDVLERTQLVGRVDTKATNTGSWGAPGNVVYVENIEFSNATMGIMDVYILFLPGGINFIDVALMLNVDN